MLNARRWRLAVLGAACGLAVAACSSEPEATAPTIELSTTTITTLPPTTATTEAPAEDPRIAEVEAAVAAFRDVLVEVLTDPTAPVERFDSVAGGDLLVAISANTEKARAEGSTTTGSFLLSPLATDIDGSSAVHQSCGLDALAGFAADGSPTVPADEVAYLRSYLLELESPGEWRVVEIFFPGTEKTPCDI